MVAARPRSSLFRNLRAPAPLPTALPSSGTVLVLPIQLRPYTCADALPSPGVAGNQTCAQQFPPAGCRSPPGWLRALAEQRSCAGSWRKSEELVTENLGKDKGKKKKNPGTWQDPMQVSMRNPMWPSLARGRAGDRPGLSRGPRRCQCPPNLQPGPGQAWSGARGSGGSASPLSQRRWEGTVPRCPGSRLPLVAPVTYLLLSV